MPTFRITVVNKDFSSCTYTDLEDMDAARRQALNGALQIGTDEVCGGKPFFGAEISIEDDDKVVERLLVSIGQSPLRSQA